MALVHLVATARGLIKVHETGGLTSTSSCFIFHGGLFQMVEGGDSFLYVNLPICHGLFTDHRSIALETPPDSWQQ